MQLLFILYTVLLKRLVSFNRILSICMHAPLEKHLSARENVRLRGLYSYMFRFARNITSHQVHSEYAQEVVFRREILDTTIHFRNVDSAVVLI